VPHSRHIFVIDDDPSIRRALGRVLAQAGLTWDVYESADQFFDTADLNKSGCVLADMTMLGSSGLDLKGRLNATRHTHPLIFLTADDSDEIRAAARDAGAVGFFRKPVDTQALLDAIEWALQQPTDPSSKPFPETRPARSAATTQVSQTPHP
jgi:FixJ family two-component response regulator